MNIFFTKQYTYTLYESCSTVRLKMERIITKQNTTENIVGILNNDNSFQLTHHLSLLRIKWVENDPAYLKGYFHEENGKTKIVVTVRPNSAFVLGFYSFIAFMLYHIFSINSVNNHYKTNQIIFFLLPAMLSLFIIKLPTKGLRKNFEKAMHLNPIT